MKSVKVTEALSKYAGLDDKEKEIISNALNKVLNKSIIFSETDLSNLNETELETIESIMSGYILTRDYTPDIRDAYEKLKNKPLPSSVSFGPFSNNG